MSHMKKGLLLAMCVLCCLLLTGCYTETDPWPDANGLNGGEATAPPAVTVVPATEVPPTQPPATVEPLPEDAVDVAPNFNG